MPIRTDYTRKVPMAPSTYSVVTTTTATFYHHELFFFGIDSFDNGPSN